MQTKPPTNHFVAWGRLFGGLAISVAGALGLHAIQNKDANAFAIVASVSGLVLSGWGFAATNLSPKARREDVLWAWLLFGLLLGSLAANAYYNRRDYGVAYIGIELIAVALAAVLGLSAYAISGLFFKRGQRPDHERRGQRLVAMMACSLVCWPLLRWPLMALALGGAIGSGEQSTEESITAAAMRRDMPAPLLRWAVHVALKSESPERRASAVDASRAGKLLDSFELSGLVLDDTDPFVRIEALRVLAVQDPSAAAAAIMETVKRKTALSNFFFQDWLVLLAPAQLDAVFESPYAKSAVQHAYSGQVASVLVAAIRKFGMKLAVEMMCVGYTSPMTLVFDYDIVAKVILTKSGVREQAEIFDHWKPSEDFWSNTRFDVTYTTNIHFWAHFRRGAKIIYFTVLRSSNPKVLDAAYRSLLATVTNPEAFRAALEPAQSSPEERTRAACKKLLESLGPSIRKSQR